MKTRHPFALATLLLVPVVAVAASAFVRARLACAEPALAGSPASTLAPARPEPPAPSRATAPRVERSACPDGSRLVDREHWDKVEHVCTDTRGKYCFGFEPGTVHKEEPRMRVRVCMDAFEAPNTRGARPIVMKSAVEAEAWCDARGKRLCSEAEWEAACEGPSTMPYVYGWKSEPATCNSGKAWRPFSVEALRAGGAVAEQEVSRLWQGEPSGSRPSCTSPEGVQDLMGNVEEWVRARAERPYRDALKGGFWAKPWSTCRGTNDAHDTSFRFYEVGFRCCADPR